MDNVEKLAKLFSYFPGIGERQSRRFVYFLLSSDPTYVRELSALISEIKKNVTRCSYCFRYYEANGETICNVCADPKTDKTTLLVVDKDADFESMRKSKSYKGFYFVLGGLVPLVEKEMFKTVRVNELKARIEKEAKEGVLKEIILAFSSSTLGDHTDMYLREVLFPITNAKGIKVTSLGRGLSTGTELEYSDSETLKHAINNRQ